MSVNKRILKQCPTCKVEFKARNYPHRKQKYCSDKCWSIRNPPHKIICKCGKEILTYEKNKKFCSNECRNLDYKTRTGEQSHLWKGGKTEFNKILRTRADFRQWRELVFERDGYTCQKCKEKSRAGKHIELHPHHIKPLSEHPELAYDIHNGITLCYDCHFNLHHW